MYDYKYYDYVMKIQSIIVIIFTVYINQRGAKNAPRFLFLVCS